MTDARTIVFFPEGAFGPTNNCVGIGKVLRARGHRVVFIVEESFAGTLEAKGFEERLMRLGPPPAEPEVPGPVLDRLHPRHRAGLPQVRRSSSSASSSRRPGRRSSMARSTSTRAWPRSSTRSRPDVIVEDNVVGVPGDRGERAAVGPHRVVQPDGDEGPRAIAPFSVRLSRSRDRTDWPAFLDEVRRTHGDMWADFDAFCRDHGETGLSYGPLGPEFIAESPYLNLYSYPAEADYERADPLGPTWHRLDSTVRAAGHDLGAARAPAPSGTGRRSTSPWGRSARRTSG